MAGINFMGLYPDAIEDVIERCENALYEAGCSKREISDMYENTKEQLNETADFNDLTNCIIEALFVSTEAQLKEKAGIKVEYYVNCDDSHLYIKDGDNTIEYFSGEIEEFLYEQSLQEWQNYGDENYLDKGGVQVRATDKNGEAELGHKLIERNVPIDEKRLQELDYTFTFIKMLEQMDISVYKDRFDGKYYLNDSKDGCKGDGYKDISEIINDIFLEESYCSFLKEIAENDLGSTDVPKTAEDWKQFMDNNKEFKLSHQREYRIVEMLSSPHKENIDLDMVVWYFNNNQERMIERERDLKSEIAFEKYNQKYNKDKGNKGRSKEYER